MQNKNDSPLIELSSWALRDITKILKALEIPEGNIKDRELLELIDKVEQLNNTIVDFNNRLVKDNTRLVELCYHLQDDIMLVNKHGLCVACVKDLTNGGTCDRKKCTTFVWDEIPGGYPTKCRFPAGISLKPDGENEIDACIYEDISRHNNVDVVMSECINCGHVELRWYRKPETVDLEPGDEGFDDEGDVPVIGVYYQSEDGEDLGEDYYEDGNKGEGEEEADNDNL